MRFFLDFPTTYNYNTKKTATSIAHIETYHEEG
jgi:hypothetical protein